MPRNSGAGPDLMGSSLKTCHKRSAPASFSNPIRRKGSSCVREVGDLLSLIFPRVKWIEGEPGLNEATYMPPCLKQGGAHPSGWRVEVTRRISSNREKTTLRQSVDSFS
jgi:hypothetical protein